MSVKLYMLLLVLCIPVHIVGQGYQKWSDYVNVKESDFKRQCDRRGLHGHYATSISGSPEKLKAYLHDFTTIPADSGYEIVKSDGFYSGKALFLTVEQLVPFAPTDSSYRFFLSGHQDIKNLPSFLGTDGRAYFELTISFNEVKSQVLGVTSHIELDVRYWILANPTKLTLLRKWRQAEKKYTDNPDYPDPVESELVEKLQRFFEHLEKHISDDNHGSVRNTVGRRRLVVKDRQDLRA